MKNKSPKFKKHIALPPDHGSWVFLLSPLIIGTISGGIFRLESFLLIVAALGAFFLRQPIVIAIKVLAKRRSKNDLTFAYYWIRLYSLLTLPAVIFLLLSDYAFILYLAIPGVLIFIWYLWNIFNHKERHHKIFDIIASGVLALVGPASYWIGIGKPDPIGWVLWLLIWAQSSASIFHAFLRLSQRNLVSLPSVRQRIISGLPTLLFVSFNLVIVIFFTVINIFPPFIFLPYFLQFGESIYGTFIPAINVKPTKIGIRQLIVSTLFTILFILSMG